jgi:hypothetical protein
MDRATPAVLQRLRRGPEVKPGRWHVFTTIASKEAPGETIGMGL